MCHNVITFTSWMLDGGDRSAAFTGILESTLVMRRINSLSIFPFLWPGIVDSEVVKVVRWRKKP